MSPPVPFRLATLGGGIRQNSGVRVPIRGESITLGKLLKLAGLVETGGRVKAVLEEGAVSVNGEPETRRGRKVRPGDVVHVEFVADVIEVVCEGDTERLAGR